MKKLLAVLLCLLMVLPFFAFETSAADEVKNIAVEGQTFGSSMWNDWSHWKYLIDTVKSSSYMFWRPGGSNGEPVEPVIYCGVKWKQYKSISKVTVYAMFYTNQNIKYRVQALVLGEWVDVGAIYNNDAKKGTNGNEYYDAYTLNEGHAEAVMTLNLAEPVNTKSIRLVIEDWGNRGGNGQWWDVPIIDELEVYGTDGYVPEYDVPEGALITKDAALAGLAYASSHATSTYAAFVNDSNTASNSWIAGNANNGEYAGIALDTAYNINKMKIYFGVDCPAGMVFDVEVKKAGENAFTKLFTGLETLSDYSQCVEKTFDAVSVEDIRIVFTDTKGHPAQLAEIEAWIPDTDDTKAIFLSDYINTFKKASTAGGNLACYGAVYASSNFRFGGLSDEMYLNDGEIDDSSYIWLADNYACDGSNYFGVVLRDTYKVDKVALYFNDPGMLKSTKGVYVMEFDVQAKVGNEYVTVAEGVKSYATSTKQHKVAVEFNAVETNDIRIVFRTNGGLMKVIPYAKELEVYSSEYQIEAYDGFSTDRPIGGLRTTDNFKD